MKNDNNLQVSIRRPLPHSVYLGPSRGLYLTMKMKISGYNNSVKSTIWGWTIFTIVTNGDWSFYQNHLKS
jgi:hypothetical protein